MLITDESNPISREELDRMKKLNQLYPKSDVTRLIEEVERAWSTIEALNRVLAAADPY